ncbi:MAG TPA: DinB family protein [Actinophytocola sp.]|uniref:DinB family protein n=1 Tax=Actinophytocola sp. TaxID=1872138 RepID=UPI002DBC1BAF|nr:DinB family protein [Actinophytocola sp.]HEU5472407.1 DinB family protein [Actinophytocola sp.]
MIVPDTKDWTWVLHRPCPDCGYDASTVAGAEVPDRLRANAAAWRPVLTGPADPRVRPAPDVWSPLEYACHVRDTCRVFDGRLRLMLTEDDPHYPNWDQDATAVEDRYAEQDPALVAEELATAAETLAARFASVSGAAWRRTGHRGDGADFTVDTFARYFLHDPVHHLHDVGGGAMSHSATGIA